MDSFPKDAHRYAFAMLKAVRSMLEDMAEIFSTHKQLRFNV